MLNNENAGCPFTQSREKGAYWKGCRRTSVFFLEVRVFFCMVIINFTHVDGVLLRVPNRTQKLCCEI